MEQIVEILPMNDSNNERLELDEQRTVQLLTARTTANETRREQSNFRDKAVMSLAGGLLAFSVSFIDQIVGDGHPSVVWLLFLSWAVLGIALAAVLISYELSVQAHKNSIDAIDHVLRLGSESPSDLASKGRFGKTVRYLNWASLGFLLIGVGSFSAFGALNLP